MSRKKTREPNDPHQWSADVVSVLKGTPPPTGVLKAVLERQKAAKKAKRSIKK